MNRPTASSRRQAKRSARLALEAARCRADLIVLAAIAVALGLLVGSYAGVPLLRGPASGLFCAAIGGHLAMYGLLGFPRRPVVWLFARWWVVPPRLRWRHLLAPSPTGDSDV